MITLPDFKQKQILFIKTENGISNKIKFHNDNIVFEKNDQVENRASCHKVFSVFILGNISITSELIRNCKIHGISIFLLNNNFQCYAFINSINSGNYLLRKKQYFLEDEKEVLISKIIVLNKIENQFRLLKFKNKKITKDFADVKKMIEKANSLSALRGIEGNISKDFFNVYFEETGWFARMPRVKPDIQNFLLDMGYTFLFNFIDALLNLFGFDTYKGFYHKLFFQRKSLVCDIIEPFRCLIDREILKMFNLKIINQKDFKYEKGKVFINYKNSSKYINHLCEVILQNKEEIYKYILDFYHYIFDSSKYKFPYFKIRR